jgi:ketosteroid isomerase-like protein
MTRNEEAIKQMFSDYVRAFQTLDPRAVVSYCHVPCTLITDKGVLLMQSASEIEALFKQMTDALKARQYARSELADLRARQVSAYTAFLSVSRIRYKADGQELERLSETYVLRNTDNGWKIAVAAIHDPDTMLRLS